MGTAKIQHIKVSLGDSAIVVNGHSVITCCQDFDSTDTLRLARNLGEALGAEVEEINFKIAADNIGTWTWREVFEELSGTSSGTVAASD